jgi:hypothetical protein
VASACNPSSSGGRDQEDCGSKSAWTNSSTRPYFEKPFTKIGLVEWLNLKALSLSPSTVGKKKKKKGVGCSSGRAGGPQFKPWYSQKKTNKH